MASDVDGEYKLRHRVCLPAESCATPAPPSPSTGVRIPKSPSRWQSWPSLMLRSAYRRNWSIFGEPLSGPFPCGMQTPPSCSAYVSAFSDGRGIRFPELCTLICGRLTDLAIFDGGPLRPAAEPGAVYTLHPGDLVYQGIGQRIGGIF